MKGVPELLASFLALQRRGAAQHWQLDIAGWCDDAALMAELNGLRDQCAPGTVRILGPVFGEAKDALVNGADLFALPSHHEALPMAALEAMAAGVPVCVTVECNLQAAVDARAAFGLAMGEAMVDDLARLLAMPDAERDAVSVLGRAFVERRYAFGVVGRQFAEFYATLLGASRSAALESAAPSGVAQR